MSNLYSIGGSGLRAAQAQLNASSNNIANVDAPGYSRQNALLSSGFGGGSGVSISGIGRDYSRAIGEQLNAALSRQASLQAQSSSLATLESLYGSGGLDQSLNDFFSASASLADAPSSSSTRQALIGDAEALVGRFNAYASQLDEIATTVDKQLASTQGQIEDGAAQLAELNKQIVRVRAQTGSEPNELLDQRDQLVSDLSELADVRVVEQDGLYNLSFADGTALVLGERAVAVPEAAWQRVQGGTLGGLNEFNQGALAEARSGLDGLMKDFADSVGEAYSAQLFGYQAPQQEGDVGRLTLEVTDADDLVTGEGSLLDGSRMRAIADLQDSQRFGDRYAAMVSKVGTSAANVEARLTTQQSLTSELSGAMQSISGVDLNEEAVRLAQYQRFYQANAQVIQTATNLLDTILAIR
ncbi:flagellar hook-associated protein FlgK [Halotalea alkalilenta]|uniref:flagellar hook-associated protein FlgK n=1 Tax=Halotalea alkalilenta TaxID=376489 RepID=UPI000487CC38|nr:flagellar hook-associated protein FlgK [Halotalea alkalilenta]